MIFNIPVEDTYAHIHTHAHAHAHAQSNALLKVLQFSVGTFCEDAAVCKSEAGKYDFTVELQ